MSNKLIVLAAFIVCSVSAIGCAGPNLQTRVDELTREKEDLERQNQQLEGRLAAADAKYDALAKESARRTTPTTPMKAGEKSNEYQLPEDLKDSGLKIRRRGNETVIEVPSDVFFASGVSTLNHSGETVLGKVADVLRKQHPTGTIRIDGHTDSDPIRRTKSKFHCNLDLGFERAHTVAHYLIDHGHIDPKRVAIETFGENQPQDPANKAKNRRVEIVLAP